jgi:hypothetical protein
MSFHVHPYQQDKWDFSPVIPKITSPCKHRGVYPVAGSLVGGEKMPAGAFVFLLKLHCPKDDCEFYLSEFTTTEWNAHNPGPVS